MNKNEATNIPDPAQPLRSIKQEAFAIAVAAGKTNKQAAIDAGYAKNSAPQQAHDLITSPSVIARVSTLTRMALDERGITPDYLISKAFELVEKCLNQTYLDKFGNAHDKAPDSRGTMAAIEYLSKLLGMLDANADQGEDNGILMSAAERRAKFRAILAAAGAKLEE